MKSTERDLFHVAITSLAAASNEAEVLGLVALKAEIAAKSEEHPECRELLERGAETLREREREIRKQNLGASPRRGPKGRVPRRHA